MANKKTSTIDKKGLKIIKDFLIEYDLGINETPFEDEVYIIPKKTLEDLKNDTRRKKNN